MKTSDKPITIAITTGEPSGIGPDISLKIACKNQKAKIVFIGCPELLQKRADLLSLNVIIKQFNERDFTVSKQNVVTVLPVATKYTVKPGKLDSRNSNYVLNVLKQGLNGCIDGDFDAIVTAPVHKGIINDSGVSFTGHTEWFAEQTNTSKVVMMFACDNLNVALATTHIPLAKVPDAIEPVMLKDVITTLHVNLQQLFNINKPHIRVCGLNPHAGENGYLGKEESVVIIPVIELCRKEGINLSGPYPADTVFNLKDPCDCILAMYHDQGLPVVKYQGFGNAVNVSLGLPIIRTSVDHGTAIDLAGSNLACENSLQSAVNLAYKLAQNKRIN